MRYLGVDQYLGVIESQAAAEFDGVRSLRDEKEAK
jgi:hypothetical protein